MQKKATEGRKTANKKPEPKIDIRNIVRRVNEYLSKANENSMAAGEYILDAVFQGNLEDAFSRNPYKNRSLRQIADDPKLLVDRRSLANCVKAAAFKRHLGAEKVDCSKLHFSHFVALLKVKDDKERKNLTKKANQREWSVRRILSEIKPAKVGSSKNDKVEDLMKKVENPKALLQDKSLKKLLEDATAMEEQFDTTQRLAFVKHIDRIVEDMLASAEILKRAKKTIVSIELDGMKSAA
jgi:hypothetical protein